MITFLKFMYNETQVKYKLTSIDPKQVSIYKNIGIENITKLNLLKPFYFKDILPNIYMEKKIQEDKKYDIIFINDYFDDEDIIDNSIKLLNKKGYIIIEIINNKINKLFSDIEKKYKNIKKVDTDTKNIIVFIKKN